jgi:hypothetical protein
MTGVVVDNVNRSTIMKVCLKRVTVLGIDS